MAVAHLRAYVQSGEVTLVGTGTRATFRDLEFRRRYDGPELQAERSLLASLPHRLWCALRRAFPTCFGASLMPTHLHLLAEVLDLMAARDLLEVTLRNVTRGLGLGIWKPIEVPMLVPDAEHLQRQSRYVELNPDRAKPPLTDDPLAWMFSTHRDVVGAVVDPWVDAREMARLFGQPAAGFAAWWHDKVSGDPSVAVEGTPPPRPADPSDLPRCPLEDIALAAAVATRSPVSAVRCRGMSRDLFIALAFRQGWRSARVVAEACGLTANAVRRAFKRGIASETLDVGALVLGDERLLRPPDWPKGW